MEALSVLIVEDDNIISMALGAFVQRLGHRVLGVCESGELACEKAKLQPDLILMDIRLKGTMNGLEAARIIQKDNPTRALFITANPDMLQPFIQDTWFHDCTILPKPVTVNMLENSIKLLFARPAK